MRVAPSGITMLTPVTAVELVMPVEPFATIKPSVAITAIIIRPAIITADNHRTRTAAGENHRRRKHGRRRQKHRDRERKPESSRLRRCARQTHTHRYQTE